MHAYTAFGLYDPIRLAALLLSAIKQSHADSFEIRSNSYFDRRAGSADLRLRLEAGDPLEQLLEDWRVVAASFTEAREPFLLYR